MDDGQLERLVDYINRKNRESDRVIITPKEVIEYYRNQKNIEPHKAFIHTLRYIDDYCRGFQEGAKERK
jgi:hypothetical protein